MLRFVHFSQRYHMKKAIILTLTLASFCVSASTLIAQDQTTQPTQQQPSTEDLDKQKAEREKNAESWAAQALKLLRRAERAGYFDGAKEREQLKRDPALAILRQRDDFKRWLTDLDGR